MVQYTGSATIASKDPLSKHSFSKGILMSERTIDEVSTSESWAISRVDAKRVHDAIPDHVRRGFNRLQSLIKRALVIVFEDGEDVEYLIGKIEAYYASEEGRGRFARLSCTWLQDEGWTEHEDLWNPDRAREARHNDKVGKTFFKELEDKDIEREEDSRREYILKQPQSDLDIACDAIIADKSNGYKTSDKIINSTLGRMLLVKRLKG